MQTEGVYRQNDLTIKRPPRLDTNRTYISRAINQQAGRAFSSYVNSYRIDEAVRRLSDVDDDTPLKALPRRSATTICKPSTLRSRARSACRRLSTARNCSNSHREHQFERNPVFAGFVFRICQFYEFRKERFINRPASLLCQ